MDTAVRRPSWERIDLEQLASNYREITRRAGGRRVVAAVKADAYGHGVVAVSQALVAAGCDSVWTGHIGDARAIRDAGVDCQIVLFGGYTPDQIPDLAAAGFDVTVVDIAGATAAAGTGCGVYVKVDAGLGRLGVPIGSARKAIGEMADIHGLTIAGVYTHLPFGDRAGREWAVVQGAAFGGLLTDLAADGISPAFTQMWGSCGLLADLPDPTNAVCIGHALYGISPFTDPALTDAVLPPVLTELGSRLIHVAEHPADAIGARAGGYLSRGAARMGVIAFGVTDGLRPSRNAPARIARMMARRINCWSCALIQRRAGATPGMRPANEDAMRALPSIPFYRSTPDTRQMTWRSVVRARCSTLRTRADWLSSCRSGATVGFCTHCRRGIVVVAKDKSSWA